MNKQILKPKLRGKRKQLPKWEGLWQKLQQSTTIHKTASVGFSTSLFMQEIYNFFNGPKLDSPRPIMIQMGVSAKSDRAANRKARKKLNKLMINENDNKRTNPRK